MTTPSSRTRVVIQRAQFFKLIVHENQVIVLIALIQFLLTPIISGLIHAKPVELAFNGVVSAGQALPRIPAPDDTLDILTERVRALNVIADSLLGEVEELRVGLMQMDSASASIVNLVETRLNASLRHLESEIRELHNELRREVTGIERDLSVVDSTAEHWRNSVSDSLLMVYSQIVSEQEYRNMMDRRLSTIAGIAVGLLLIGMCSVWWYGRRKTGLLEGSIRGIRPELTQQFQYARDALSKDFHETNIESQQVLAGLMKQIADSLGTITAAPAHELPISICNVAIRIERNLNAMDSRVRGHKHLFRCIRDIKKSLQKHGYEMPDLVGMRYETEMENLKPEFIAEDTLAPGTQTITRIDRPLILYGSRPIQGGWVTVSVGPNQ